MVFIGGLKAVCLQCAKMRVPSIKFRKGSPASSHASAAGPQKSAGGKAQSTASEDVPARYRRKPFAVEEIEYINRGGPA